MNTWFSSDYHFWHNFLAEIRGLSLEEMHEKIIKGHNGRVKPDDTVYFLGDYQLGKPKVSETLDLLNGNFTFIRGNHDSQGPNGIRSKLMTATIDLGEFDMHMCHDPADYNQMYPINLVGHVHKAWNIKTLPGGVKLVNVGVDAWNYMPCNLQDITRRIKADEKEYQARLDTENGRHRDLLGSLIDVTKSGATINYGPKEG
jgi:calcineurin-like phosphoesterase family protein